VDAALDRPLRILVADDDESLRTLLAAVLASDGHETVDVADGAELLERLARGLLEGSGWSFDLIVSDVEMPMWSGLDLLAGLSREPTAPPIILMTAFGDERTHREARRLGAITLLDKPFDLEELRALVRRVAQGDGCSPSLAIS
jgi:CheY-like chemotaxis protein